MEKEPTYIESGFQDEVVMSALSLMGRNDTIHNKFEAIWAAIQDLFEDGFTVSNPSGTKKITSKLLLQILWKVVNKMKPLDFKIHKAGPFAKKTSKAERERDNVVRDWAEQIVTAGVATVMKEGNYAQCFRDKGGIFYKMALFGDAHLHIGYDQDNSDYPITFRVGSLSDFYMNNSCTDIRDPVGGLSADEVVIIYRYTMTQFNSLFPDFEGKVAVGEVPRNTKFAKQLEKLEIQEDNNPDDIIEVAYRIGIDKRMCVFAGAACTVIQKLEDKEFPYMLDGKPYIPVLHFKFFPSSEGYYNYGIGHMVYDLAILTARMDNMAYNHAGDNVYPINFINTQSKNASKLFNEIMKAHEMRAAGGKGYVVSENPGGGSGVTIESFQTQPITQEWERAFQRLEQQITRMGFSLDLPDLGSNPNEMSIMAEQEATDAPIKQIMEFNASEFEFAVDITMDAIRKFISKNDETPINSTVDIEMGDIKTPMRGIPLGWVAEELKKNKYFVEINSRTGTIPSNVMQQAQISKTMSTLAPGTPAWNKMSIKIAQLNGQNIKEDDLAMQQMEAPGEVPPTTEPMTETSPLNAVTLKHPPKL